MKILIVHNTYSQYGGEDKVFQQEVAFLKKVLGTNHVFTYQVTSKGLSPLKIAGSIFFARKHYRVVYDLIKEHAIDLVHIHNFFPVLTGAVFTAARDAGAKIVHTLHNYRWWCVGAEFYRKEVGICTLCTQPKSFWSAVRYQCYRKSFFQSLVAQLAFGYYKKSGVLQSVDLFFVLTEFQKKILLLQGIDPNKVVVKPNWVVQKEIVSDIKNRSGYIFVGRLEPSKGIEVLLAAWEKLPIDFIITIVGTGSLENDLRRKYGNYNNIVFKGSVPPDNIQSLIQSAKYSIQPSLWYETFGLTIIESMRVGVPVIGFRVGTRIELIEDHSTGFLCSPDQLADTIQMAESYIDYSLLCEKASSFAKQFEAEPIIAKQIAYYEELLNYNRS